MLYKIALKNSPEQVVLSADAYESIKNDPYFQKIKFLENLRIHSYGYAFYQKNYPKPDGKGYKNVTIYLHKHIAEKFVDKPESEKRLLVTFANGNRLDCRTNNIVWATSSQIIRNISDVTNSHTGYRGVSKVNNKYRAVIFQGKKRFDLGAFDTAEEAAEAYNKQSIEWYGVTKSLNKIGSAS